MYIGLGGPTPEEQLAKVREMQENFANSLDKGIDERYIDPTTGQRRQFQNVSFWDREIAFGLNGRAVTIIGGVAAAALATYMMRR